MKTVGFYVSLMTVSTQLETPVKARVVDTPPIVLKFHPPELGTGMPSTLQHAVQALA